MVEVRESAGPKLRRSAGYALSLSGFKSPWRKAGGNAPRHASTG
jgi:hypothetical protein